MQAGIRSGSVGHMDPLYLRSEPVKGPRFTTCRWYDRIEIREGPIPSFQDKCNLPNATLFLR